ncbi:MAG: T9SS type A sorting domain-containing protein [Bacteroidota bacterium]
MKKLLLIVSSAFIGFSNLSAQSSIELTNNSTGIPITNNSIIMEDVATGGQSHVYIQLKNVGSSAVTYAVKKYDVVINSGADAYFCWGGQCFPPTTTITPVANYVTLNAGEVYAPQSFYYDENVQEGFTEVKYELYDVSNPNDAIVFTFKFNSLLTSLKDNSALFSGVSGVYPNPAVSKAQVSVNSKVNMTSLVTITNALGSVVSTKHIELAAGKNIITLDAENLTSGIYFATIASDNTKIVKKFTINK